MQEAKEWKRGAALLYAMLFPFNVGNYVNHKYALVLCQYHSVYISVASYSTVSTIKYHSRLLFPGLRILVWTTWHI